MKVKFGLIVTALGLLAASSRVEGGCPGKVWVDTYGEKASGSGSNLVIEQYPVQGFFECTEWGGDVGCTTIAGIPRYDRNLDGFVITNENGLPLGRPHFPSCKEAR